MKANVDLERRLADYYATEAPDRAPERVLHSVLATTEAIRQRRPGFVAPWRFLPMNSYAKAAIAAVAVIVIGVAGIAILRPGSSPGVGGPAVTLSPSPSASAVNPTPSASSRPAPSHSPAPLTQRFTSTLHGYSMSYGEGWAAQAATEPWTGALPNFGEPSGDFLYDPVLTDHLWLSVASQPIGDSTPDEWAAEHLYECTASEPTAVDGAIGLIGVADCNWAAVTTDGRGYTLRLYTSGDEPWLSTTYDRAWFEEVLATVRLQPTDAVDVAPSASP
jgi:hypothetical protein